MSETPLFAASAPFLEDAYRRYRSDPDGCGPGWRSFFTGLESGRAEPGSGPAPPGAAQSPPEDHRGAIHRLISAYRYRGFCIADVDPLNMHEIYGRPGAPDVHPKVHGFTEADLDRTFTTDSLFGPPELTLRELVDILHTTYCSHIGTELTHLTSPRQKRWVQERLERAGGRPAFTAEKKRELLGWVIAAPAGSRSSSTPATRDRNGSPSRGASASFRCSTRSSSGRGRGRPAEIVIGMAHRGRLNVLVNVLGKLPAILFEEFEGKFEEGAGSGDVKYHLGFSSDIETEGGPTHIVLAFNPSHLEIINPVVEGSVRARQMRRRDTSRNQVLPVLIHGDAAFAGQGVVTETLNLSETRGYSTGGTVHVIVNNLIGFTNSDPLDSRSSSFCTDVAKLVQAPIFHVNGNDPEAVAFIAGVALDYRMEFGHDVVIDLVSYRRPRPQRGRRADGHPAADVRKDPQAAGSPPALRRAARARRGHRRGRREAQARRLPRAARGGRVGVAAAQARAQDRPSRGLDPLPRPELEGGGRDRHPGRSGGGNRARALRAPGALPPAPGGRPSHGGRGARWRAASGPSTGASPRCLAYGSLLRDGYSIRMSGQDCERGTFAHRHATVHNQDARGTWQSLAHLFDDQPPVEVINSLLSEEAVLGFEYGYSSSEPEGLVIWEAQFGDFVNGAQVVIDQFLSSLRGQVGTLLGDRDAPPARLRGGRAGALLGAAGAVPAALRGGQPPGLRPPPPRPRSSISSGARWSGRTASRSSS